MRLVLREQPVAEDGITDVTVTTVLARRSGTYVE
jgi:hypothetical protein